MTPDEQYFFERSTIQRFNWFEYAMPTGRIFDGLYYEVRIVSNTEPSTYNFETITLRARVLNPFGAFQMPSPEWIEQNILDIYFVLAYIGGSRQTPVIVGYIPLDKGKYSQANGSGFRHFLGPNDDNRTVHDANKGLVETKALNEHRIVSEGIVSSSAKTKNQVAAGEDKKVGIRSEDGKNYLGDVEKDHSSPVAKANEVIDRLSELIDALSTATYINPAGAPTPLTFVQPLSVIKQKLDAIKSEVNFTE